MDAFLRELQPVPGQLSSGKLPKTGHWRKMMSKQLQLRADLNLHSPLLDTPDTYWHDSSVQHLFEDMERNVDIRNRIMTLNKRMDYTQHVAETVRSEIASRNTHRAELLIILLITLEVVFTLLGKSEAWQRFTWEALWRDRVKPFSNHLLGQPANHVKKRFSSLHLSDRRTSHLIN